MFIWKIEWMETSTTKINGFNQVVLTAGWRCTAVDRGYSTTDFGSIGFPQPSKDGTFTPYSNLTEELVLSWVWANGVDKADIESILQNRVEDLISPSTTMLPLPWASE
jgi:hypothetical protein